METQIESAIRVFEEIEKVRRGQDAKLTHLGNNRKCSACGKDFMPKRFEPCPECGSKNTRLMKARRRCLDCEHKWAVAEIGACPWCGSMESEESPKDDLYVRNVALPTLRADEELFEKHVREMVEAHLVWKAWAKDVKGAGLTTVGRLIGKTDIHRINTVSEMWQHCGWGMHLKCQACEHVWTSSGTNVCPKCGNTDVMGQGCPTCKLQRLALTDDKGKVRPKAGDDRWCKHCKKWIVPVEVHGVISITQGKHTGMAVDYDVHLQSNCVILAESLTKAVDKFCPTCRKLGLRLKDDNDRVRNMSCPACDAVFPLGEEGTEDLKKHLRSTHGGQFNEVGLAKEAKEKVGNDRWCRHCRKWIIPVEVHGAYYNYFVKERERALAAGLPLGHAHNRGFRHMIKLFLAHFWEVWRIAEGLPAPRPYAFGILNHPEGHYIRPAEMIASVKKATTSTRRARTQKVAV